MAEVNFETQNSDKDGNGKVVGIIRSGASKGPESVHVNRLLPERKHQFINQLTNTLQSFS